MLKCVLPSLSPVSLADRLRLRVKRQERCWNLGAGNASIPRTCNNTVQQINKEHTFYHAQFTLWICRNAISRKNCCADTVRSSRCCLVRPANASCGSFSHGSNTPGPLIRMPVDKPSITRRIQSPGLNGIKAEEMIFSANSSMA